MGFTLKGIRLPVRIRPSAPMNDEDLARFCAANGSLRIERDSNGELIVMSPAGYGSSKRNVRLTRLLDEWAEADGRGETTGPDGGYLLPDGSMRMPDAAWTSLDRLETAGGRNQEGFPPLCPDFVIELRSPSDRLAQVEAKMEMWIANGAQVAWLIDPERKVVAIFRPEEAPEVLHEPTSVRGSGPVAGFELVMARVWG